MKLIVMVIFVSCPLVAAGCSRLTGLNHNPPYDEDAAYLSVPDPRDETDDVSDSD